MEMLTYEEIDFLNKIISKEGPRMRDGSYRLNNNEEYRIAKVLEEKDLIQVFRSNGILSGFPFVAANILLEGLKIVQK